MFRNISILLLAITVVLAMSVEDSEVESHNEEPHPTEKNTKVCTKEYFPVCASDGKTYGNLCVFRNAKRINPELTYEVGRCK